MPPHRKQEPSASTIAYARPFPDRLGIKKAILEQPLTIENNTAPKYSNLGFALIGLVVEAVTGQHYGDFVTTKVLEPLMMRSAVADFSDNSSMPVATDYCRAHAPGERHEFGCRIATNALAPATGVFSVPEDMCRFAASHYWRDDGLLTIGLLKEANRSQWVIPDGYDAGAEYGLGAQVMRVGRRRLVGHTGSLGGYQSATFRDPQRQLAVSVAANCRDAPAVRILRGIFQAIYHFEDACHLTSDTDKFNARVTSPLATVEIVVAGERVVAIDPGDWEPFTFAEDMAVVSPTALRVTTSGSLFNYVELAEYTFCDDRVRSVNYGGFEMLTIEDEDQLNPASRRLLPASHDCQI